MKSALLVCSVFFLGFLVLSIHKHNSYLTGYDLGIADQIVWKYSQFISPITTTNSYYDASALADHLELIYPLIAVFYRIYSHIYMLLLLQVFAVTSSGIAVYLFLKKRGIIQSVSLVLLINYFLFYGVQQAIWSDVHSIVFGFSFLAWFIYALEANKPTLTMLFFVLAILCKENIALLTLSISVVYFILYKRKTTLLYIVLSLLYIISVFFIYFPHFTPGYRYQSGNGLLSDLNPTYMMNTQEKREVLFYSLLGYGGLSLLSPVLLIPAIVDLSQYFVFGNSSVTGSHGLFGHYRITLSLFLLLPVGYAISQKKWLHNKKTAIYLLLFALVGQYLLHSPLSYLSKSWFVKQSDVPANINYVLTFVPKDASVAAQNNIVPHLTHRKDIYTLLPEKKVIQNNGIEEVKSYLKWPGSPEYIVVDTSSDWDIRHLLTDRNEFIAAVDELIHTQSVEVVASKGNAKVLKMNINNTIH